MFTNKTGSLSNVTNLFSVYLINLTLRLQANIGFVNRLRIKKQLYIFNNLDLLSLYPALREIVAREVGRDASNMLQTCFR